MKKSFNKDKRCFHNELTEKKIPENFILKNDHDKLYVQTTY